MSDPAPTPSRVCLQRDIDTDIGTFHQGLHIDAVPVETGWVLHLSTPGVSHSPHLHFVPADWARPYGTGVAAAKKKACAHEEYWFVRRICGYSDQKATEWLAKTMSVSFKTLRSWGFNTAALERRESRTRQREAS